MRIDPNDPKSALDDRREPLVGTLLKAKSTFVERLRNAGVIDVALRESGFDTAPNAGSPETAWRIPYTFLSFGIFVLLPFLASIIYYVFIASDQYIAEARFAVRSVAEERSNENVDAGVLSMSTMSQDAYIVTSFIHSTEILQRIGKTFDYRAMFSRDGADIFSRFEKNEATEDFLRYWEDQVTTYIDGPSGIITLKTRTFSPEDSRQLASAIISESEKLINELSERARRDVIQRFAKEVERTTENYRQALSALNNFQNTTGFLTPEARATETGSVLAGLVAQKLELDTRLFVLKASNAESSPARQQLSLASENLEGQIVKLREQLAGGKGEEGNIASAINAFSALETDRRVAESLYESAQNNLETAQTEAARKSLYVVVFVPPTVPEEALYPHRWSSPFLILLALSVAWVTLALIWASVEDHRL